jgi:nucleoside permease NupC
MSGSAIASSWCAGYLAMDVILTYVVWITLLAYPAGPGAAATGAKAILPLGRRQAL